MRFIFTGTLVAVAAPYLFAALKLKDPSIRGFVVGVASHGIGAARAFQFNEQSGAVAVLATGLNGALTAVLLPIIGSWPR